MIDLGKHFGHRRSLKFRLSILLEVAFSSAIAIAAGRTIMLGSYFWASFFLGEGWDSSLWKLVKVDPSRSLALSYFCMGSIAALSPAAVAFFLAVASGTASIRVAKFFSFFLSISLFCWSWYYGPRDIVAWHLPLVLYGLLCCVALSATEHAVNNLKDGSRASVKMFSRAALVACVAYLVASHGIWQQAMVDSMSLE